MIRTFANNATAAIYLNKFTKGLPREIQLAARRKLAMLDLADTLESLRSPPGNRLEALRADRKGQWSVRINGQWRLCFRFENGEAYDVEVVDYH
jgi:proteic killer suppression protein